MLRHRISPSPAPSPTPISSTSSSSSSSTQQQQTQSKLPVDFSPPLIAMVVIIVTAFIIITYSRLLSRHCLHTYRKFRRWRRRRRRYVLSTTAGDIDSPPHHLFDEQFHVLSPYGLDESIIKTIPLSIYTAARKSGGFHDCAVCLLEFELNDYVRTLPICSHAFHVDCIDIWLRSHANCPLCRAGISPFTPLMAARIRPSLDDIVIEIESDPIDPIAEEETEIEIVLEPNRRDFLLKRSYSFGFERSNLGSEQVLEAVTASPYRKSFWNKRNLVSQSPFTKHRVFSFRYYRSGMKSPLFLRRRSISGFYPLSESNGSSRRSKSSFASPMFMTSRLRSGDPEALLSPERYNRR